MCVYPLKYEFGGTGMILGAMEKWDFGKTEPLFFISVELARRAEVLAAASFAVAAASVFCFCDQLSTLGKLFLTFLFLFSVLKMITPIP
jgi:hypothetical protein